MNIYVSIFSDTELNFIRQNQLGCEISAYSSAKNLDNFDKLHPTVTQNIQGIKNFSMHGPYDGITYATNDPLIFEVTKKRFHQSIQAASFHGVKHLVLHSAYRRFFQFKKTLTQFFVNTSIDFWKTIEKDIPDGMTVFIENVEDEDPQLLAEVINGIDSPKISCCFDVGHAFSNSDIPLDTWIKVLGSKIGHVHIHDNDGKSDLHLPLGSGNIPMLETIRLIMEHAGEEVPFVLECDVAASIDWIKSNKLL